MDNVTIKKFLKKMGQDLEGQWILVGGALLLALDLSDRMTIDIDLVPVNRATNQDTLKLMDISQDLNMPPETINLSAEYFLKKIKGWEKELILLQQTKKCKIYRPSKKLFKKLKEARGTSTDMLDIKAYEKLNS
jgi:hypothetical protein